MLRQPLLMLARSDKVKNVVTSIPVSSSIVSSYVPGESTEAAVDATRGLIEQGLHVTLDFLGEDTLDVDHAEATVAAYVELLKDLADRGLARQAEVSVKLSAIGQALPDVGDKVALENARTICRAATSLIFPAPTRRTARSCSVPKIFRASSTATCDTEIAFRAMAVSVRARFATAMERLRRAFSTGPRLPACSATS